MDTDDPAPTAATGGKNDLPWVEKYRPNKLSDLIAHEDIIRIIDKLIDSNNLPHLLLYGPPGTGKTSTIVAAAKKMYGPKKYSSMTLELNASDSRGIDVVRNEIKEFAGTKNLFASASSASVKLIILDEADAMTSDAQFALRRVIEKYAKNAVSLQYLFWWGGLFLQWRWRLDCAFGFGGMMHVLFKVCSVGVMQHSSLSHLTFFLLFLVVLCLDVDLAFDFHYCPCHLFLLYFYINICMYIYPQHPKQRFCLICNYVSKIIPALQSRCTRFRFAPLQPSQIQGRLEFVAHQENIDLTPDAIQAILNLSGGDMRRVLNLLQSSAMSAGNATTALGMEEGGGNAVDDQKTDGGKVALTGTEVYLTSGSPLPEDIDEILDVLLNEQSFQVACEKITNTCSTKGYALADVLKDIALKIGTGTLKLDTPALARLLDGMSQVEDRLASGTSESIQTASLVGVFLGTRQRLQLV
jgi:DNA polymerase III delta prime subunit